jgi:hypothetical protein
MQLPTSYPFIFKESLQLGYICSIFLHELDVEPSGRIPWNATLGIEVTPCVSTAFFRRRKRGPIGQPSGRRL